MLKMIWCQDVNGGIGINNKMPWNIKQEMQHFIQTTKNHVVVMGRKTFESIGRPLPNRTNIVLSNNPSLKIVGVKVINNFQEIIDLPKTQDVFIIGGASIYRQFLNDADQLVVSCLPDAYECTEYLKFNLKDFKIFKTEDKELFIVKYYERIR